MPHPARRRAIAVARALGEIRDRFGGELIGDANCLVQSAASLETAGPGDIAFSAGARYRDILRATRATAVIVGESDRDTVDLPRIVVSRPQVYFAGVIGLLHPAAEPVAGVHATAVIGEGAVVPASASVGPHASIGARTILGERCVVAAGAHIGADCTLGADCVLHANVVVYHDCHIGQRTVLHSGVVIGADGFGLVMEGDRWLEVPQVGRVLIGADVQVGANTTIDRGALDDTVIEDGVKLDNQIQIGHNCRIGAHTAIAGCVGIAGSARIGRHCMIGGAAGIHGHIDICDGCTISAFTLITKSIAVPGTYTSATPFLEHRDWLRNTVRMRNLDELAERVARLERERRDNGKGDPA